MENRSRNTIAGRAAILGNGDTGIVEQFPSTNSITGRAAIVANNNSRIPKQSMKKPSQLSGQRDMKNYEQRQMAGGSAPARPNSGNAGARQMELNLKVSPPPSNSPVQRNVEVRRSNSLNLEDTGVISRERLQEAIIWSEILGEPLSKRKRRNYS
jgi:hypothetical protein